jgi:hypothetical protein
MKKSATLKLKVACLSTSAYGLLASLNENIKSCPASVRTATKAVCTALGSKHMEMMFESSCKLVKAMDKAFTKDSSIYKIKGFQGETIRDWYLWTKLFLVSLNQIDDKKTKKWLETDDGAITFRLIQMRVVQIAEELVKEDKNVD